MKKVEIYSTPSCHFCHMAKEFFAEHNIPFTDYDVASDASRRSEMIEKSGQMGVPVIVIDDADLIIGFNKQKVAELLGVPA
jgi:glutaredoxin 3